MNKVDLEGTIVTDVKKMSEKGPCAFKLKTYTHWRGKKQDGKTNHQYHRIVVWGNLADKCVEALKQGDIVKIEGMLKYDKLQYVLRDENKKPIIHNGEELKYSVERAEVKAFKVNKVEKIKSDQEDK